MELPEKISYLRKANGMTLEEVGKIVGVARGTVLRWENGQIENMKRDKIAALAVALHTSPAYLMGWTDDPDEEKTQDKYLRLTPKQRELIDLIGSLSDQQVAKILQIIQLVSSE